MLESYGKGWHGESGRHSEARRFGAREVKDPMKYLAMRLIKKMRSPTFDNKEHLYILYGGKLTKFGGRHHFSVEFGDFFTTHQTKSCYTIHNHPSDSAFHSPLDIHNFLRHPNVIKDVVVCSQGMCILSKHRNIKPYRGSRFDLMRLNEVYLEPLNLNKDASFLDTVDKWGRRILLPLGVKPSKKDFAAGQIISRSKTELEKEDIEEDKKYKPERKLTKEEVNKLVPAFKEILLNVGRAYGFDVEFRDLNWRLI